MHIRRAVPTDANALTALFLRSKAHWGYDAAFMARMAELFPVLPDYIDDWPVYVLEDRSGAVGFYGFKMIGDRFFLNDMFVLPEHIGTGLGKKMWAHALETARASGHLEFFIESDPGAVPFYLTMGAEDAGTVTSQSGRELPLLHYAV